MLQITRAQQREALKFRAALAAAKQALSRTKATPRAEIAGATPVYASLTDLPCPVAGSWATVADDGTGSPALMWADGVQWVEMGTAPAPTPVAAPTGASATALSSTVIRVQWTDNAIDETAYEIERSLNGTTWSLAATLAANTVLFDDTGRSASTKYYYRVRAYRGGDGVYSAYSSTVYATTPSNPTITVQPYVWWRDTKWIPRFPYEDANWTAWSLRDNASYYYFVGDGIDACANIFEASVIAGAPDKTYLDHGIRYTLNMISKARVSSSISTSQYKDSYYGWPSAGDGGVESVLREMRCWARVAVLVRQLHGATWLHSQMYDSTRTYGQILSLIVTFSNKHLWEKWWVRGGNSLSQFYRVNMHMTAHAAVYALGFSVATTDPVLLAQFSKVYHEVSTGPMTALNGAVLYSGSDIQNELVPNPVSSTATFWNYDWNVNTRPGSDLGHAGDVELLMIEGYDHSTGVWSWAGVKGIEGMINLTLNVLWYNGMSDPRFHDYLDGTDDSNVGIYGRCFSYWARIGRYSQAIQKLAENHSFRSFYPATMYGHGALNAARIHAGM